MTRILLLSLVGSLSLSLSLPASASSVIGYGSGTQLEDKEPMSKYEFETEQRDLFISADLDNNSHISFEETQEMMIKQQRKIMRTSFDQFDKDYNGYLTKSEMSQYYNPKSSQPTQSTPLPDEAYDKMVDEALEKFDTDENGSISRDEMSNGIRTQMEDAQGKSQNYNSNLNVDNPYFTHHDKDKDGTVSFDEYAGGSLAHRAAYSKFQRIYMRDQDMDGTITYSENETFIADIFEGLDKDEDGTLSTKEQMNSGMYSLKNIQVGASGIVVLHSYEGVQYGADEITPGIVK